MFIGNWARGTLPASGYVCIVTKALDTAGGLKTEASRAQASL